MPVDHSKHGFLRDIGTDWVALSPNGTPLARAHDEETVRRAAPDAADYVTGEKPKAKKAEPAPAEPVVTDLKHLGPDDGEQSEAEQPAATEPEAEQPEPADAAEPESHPAADHDGDGKAGGSEKGENATASKTRRQRKPA